MCEFYDAKTIGIISDTHNLLRPEALVALQNSDLIIHAGDIGNRIIIDELKKIAPVIVVRGNVDQAEWCKTLPESIKIAIGEIEILVIHNLKELDVQDLSQKTTVVISGHSHKPSIQEKNSVLFLNPGSAGRRRFRLPISIAQLKIDGSEIQAEIIELSV
jgi:uncharacterized protein